MIQTFQSHAGKMFPTEGNIFIAPFMDDTLYLEQMMKVNFWYVHHSFQHSTCINSLCKCSHMTR